MVGGRSWTLYGRPRPFATIAGAVLFASLACGEASTVAGRPALARGQSATPDGARLFDAECSGCHGRRGAGFADAPPILGPRGLPEFPRDTPPSGVIGVYDPAQSEIESQTRRVGATFRPPFHDAGDVGAYLVAHLSKARRKAIHADGLWAIVTFMMAVQGAAIPEGGVTPENAASLPIPR